MSLREEMWKYEQITGESAEHVPIIKLGAFLDGYEMAIKTLKVMCDNCPMYNCVCGCPSYRHIEKMQSVTPKAKIGRWIADVDKWGEIVTTVNGYRCSECNTFNTDKDNYCPNCGAKMGVEE